MSKLGFTAVVAGCLAIASSGVFGQDAKTDRREKIKQAAEIAAGLAVKQIPNGVVVSQPAGEMLSGHVLVLQGKSGTEAQELNQGGLLVVRVPDSGSRPPKDLKVEAGRQFVRLGQLEGVGQKNGKSLAGGGFTWILLKPAGEGEANIVVTFMPNGGGEAVKREYKVNVTPDKSDAVAKSDSAASK